MNIFKRMMKEKLKDKFWSKTKNYFYMQRVEDSTLIQNINYDVVLDQPRVLMCYLTGGYFSNTDDNIGRTQHSEIFKIVKIFSEFGYCIDLVYCNDIRSIQILSKKKYQIIFGFGETFYQMVSRQPDAISILYMTEHHPEFSFDEEKKRIEYYYARHGRHVSYLRSGRFYSIKHIEEKYSHLISMSEVEPFLKQYNTPFCIFPSGIINYEYRYKIKNHDKSRTNFLWLGSAGAVHKGLDLLIDIFSNRNDLTLHIAGLRKEEKKFLSIPKKGNIIDYGYINIQSKTFLNLIDLCSFIILPSCSEACSTSITTGMLHGLIPIVMKNAGFNRLKGHTIFLDDFKISYIDSMLSKVASMTKNELDIFSRNVYSFAHDNFTISNFEQSFRGIISSIINK